VLVDVDDEVVCPSAVVVELEDVELLDELLLVEVEVDVLVEVELEVEVLLEVDVVAPCGGCTAIVAPT
jgi:hypothetical protein